MRGRTYDERSGVAGVHLEACVPILHAFVRRKALSDELAEEVMQEACLRILRADDVPKESSRFKEWCWGVARNVWIAERKKLRTSSIGLPLDRGAFETPDFRPDPERRVYASEKLARASARLGADGAELLIRRYGFGERVVDLACERAQKPAALRMQILRLRSALRARRRRGKPARYEQHHARG